MSRSLFGVVALSLSLLAAACQRVGETDAALAVGDRAPDLRLASAAGGDVASGDLFGHAPVLL